MEYNIRKYQFHQNGKDYVVSTGIVYDRIRVTCQENLALDGPFYSNEFSLYDLQHIHQFFKITQTIEEALKEINKGIERQKTGLKLGSNDVMHFLGYLVIGTDNDVFILNLKRDYDPNKYGIFTPPSTYAADLVLSTNYKVDGQRLNRQEISAGNLQKEQTMVEEELDRIIPQINKLKKISMDIEEENALIKERIRILQKKLEQKKFNVFRLKEENANLKRENQSLINAITEQENAIRQKQAIQTKVQIKPRPNINPQSSAVVSKFEQSALRTFFPRTDAKYNTESYTKPNQDYNYIYNPTYTTEISPYTYNNDISNQVPIQTQILPTIYQVPQPVIVNVQQPVVTYAQYTPPSLRLSNRSNMSYKNNTYRAYLGTPSKNVVYQNKVYNPSLNKLNNNINNNNSNEQSAYISNNNIYANTNNNNQMLKSNSNNNMKLTTLTDKIKSYGDKNVNNNQIDNNINNNDYIKPTGSRMPKANLGNYSKSPTHNKNKGKNSPIVGYSSYKPDEDNNKK